MPSGECLLMEDIYRARDSGSVGPCVFLGCSSSARFTLEESKAMGLRRPSLASFWLTGRGQVGGGSMEKGLLGDCR